MSEDFGIEGLPGTRCKDTVPDSVVDALQNDLTHEDADTDSVATIQAGDVEMK